MKFGKKTIILLLAIAMVFAMSLSALAAVEDTGFSDVAANAWFARAIAYCVDNGLMNGTEETVFAPNDTMTRAMIATVLYRVAGSPEVTGAAAFTDVPVGAWCANAVAWAAQEGIVTGYGDGLFGINDPVSREQIAAILWRYTGSPAVETGTNFADESAIGSYAATAVDWARVNSIVNGMEGNLFAPQNSATRAEVATILMNYMNRSQTVPTPDTDDNKEPTPEEGKKVLVVYFSATNTTKTVAEYAADALGADLYAITPEEPYTTADLNYGDDNSRSSIEMNDPSSRPAISGSVENMAQYDIVFLGYPIWWGQAPKIISTFLESYDFSGKTIVPFCTSGSSGIGSSATNLQELTDGAEWIAGQRFGSGTSRESIVTWINGLGLAISAE